MPAADAPEHVLLQIRVPQTLNRRLRRIAAQRGETLTGLCRDLLRDAAKEAAAVSKPIRASMPKARRRGAK